MWPQGVALCPNAVPYPGLSQVVRPGLGFQSIVSLSALLTLAALGTLPNKATRAASSLSCPSGTVPQLQKNPGRLLLVNCPRPMYPEAQALGRSKTSLPGLEPRRTHSGRPAPFPLGCLAHDLGCLLTHNLPKTLNPESGGLDGFLGTQTASKIEPRPFSSSSYQPTDPFSPFGKQLALILFCSNL